jgi:hypothetical protein
MKFVAFEWSLLYFGEMGAPRGFTDDEWASQKPTIKRKYLLASQNCAVNQKLCCEPKTVL